MDKGKGPAIGAECDSKVADLKLSAAEVEGPISSLHTPLSSDSAGIAVFNPTPLATRCIKQNNGATGGGSNALMSAWIQRIIPVVHGEETMPSQWEQNENNPGLMKDPLHVGLGHQLSAESAEWLPAARPLGSGNVDPSYLQSMEVEHVGKMEDDHGWRKELDITPVYSPVATQSLHLCDMHGTMPSHPGLSNPSFRYQQQGWYQYSPDVPGPRNRCVPAKANLQGGRVPEISMEAPSLGQSVEPPTQFGWGGTALGGSVTYREGSSAAHDICEGKDDRSLGPTSLPPLSLFAPFKHNKELRSLERLGGVRSKVKVDSWRPGVSLLTPLFPPLSYTGAVNSIQDGGAGVLKGRFEAAPFAPFRPSVDHVGSCQKCMGVGGSTDRPSVLLPIFAPFKAAEECNEPSTSSSKTESLPLDLMDVVDHREEDTGTKPDLKQTSNDVSNDVRQLGGGSLANLGCTNNPVYSSTWLEDENHLANVQGTGRRPTIESPESGLCGIGNHRVTIFSAGSARRSCCATKPSTSRPILDRGSSHNIKANGQLGSKDISATQSLERQGFLKDTRSHGQGRDGGFHLDGDVQQHMNAQEGPAGDPILSRVSLSEGSSGSCLPVVGGDSPSANQLHVSVTPADTLHRSAVTRHQNSERSRQQMVDKGTASSSVVRGRMELQGRDAESEDRMRVRESRNEQWSTQETIGDARVGQNMQQQKLKEGLSDGGSGSNTVHMSGQGSSSEVEGGLLAQRHSRCKLWADAPGDRLGRPSTRKRSREPTSSTIENSSHKLDKASMLRSQESVGVAGRECFQTPPRAQAWLQRWMPPSNPTVSSFKLLKPILEQNPSQASPSHDIRGYSLSAQAPRLPESNNGEFVGSRVHSDHGTEWQMQVKPAATRLTELEKGNSSIGNIKRQSCLGFCTVPSAAALALVGAARRRAMPQSRKKGSWLGQIAEAGPQGSLPLQAEVQVTVEEG